MNETTGSLTNMRLERYEIQEKIGTGGMARVYKGFDTNLNRPVAIKILHDHLSEDPTFRERFTREARFVAGFNHPHIVQVYDFASRVDDRAICYMVMPYIAGETLADTLRALHLSGSRMPTDQMLRIVQDIASALDYAHASGMVHRDVKPANILISSENGSAILTDFGIARMAEHTQLTQEGSTVGTPVYMSPEQATGEDIDGRSDLYALGIILFEMLAGKPPFTDDGTPSVLLKHLRNPVPTLDSFGLPENPYLDAVISRALAKKPIDRYQSGADLVDDLQHALSGEHPAAYKTTSKLQFVDPTSTIPLESLRRFNIRQIAVWVAAAVVLIAALVFTVEAFISRETVAAPATPEPGQPLYFSSTFEEDDSYKADWPQGVLSRLDRSIVLDGFYRIDNQRSGEAVTSIFDNGQNHYRNIAIQMRAVLEDNSDSDSGYGIVFRYIDEQNYQVFAVDGAGRYSLWIRNNGEWRELRNAEEIWSPSEFVSPIGEMNTLMVEIIEDQIIGYVNGEVIVSVVDDTIQAGGVGIYVAAPPAGTATVLVDMVQVMETLDVLTDSMTITSDR